jgi:GAF domain-containing protein
VAFADEPLVYRSEILGVLAVFSRLPIREGQFTWLRTFADQAAVAIANAPAFEEVAWLRQQLELERDLLREEVREALAFGRSSAKARRSRRSATKPTSWPRRMRPCSCKGNRAPARN